MKRIMVFVMAAFLILSLAQSALAWPNEATREKVKLEVTERIRAGEDLAEKTRKNLAENEEKIKTIKEGMPVTAKQIDVNKLLGQKALVQETNFEKIRQHQKEKLEIAVQKCREQDKNPELCEKMFQARLELIDKLKAKDLKLIQELEVKKARTMKQIRKLNEEEAFANFKEEKEFKTREVNKDIAAQAQESFQRAAERLKISKDKYELVKQKFAKAKAELKQCKKEECEPVKTEIRAKIRESLLRIIEIMDNKLIQLKQKTAESETLTEEEAAALTRLIDEKLAETKELALELEAKEDVSTKDLKNLTAKVKEVLKKVANTAKRSSLKIMNSRISGIIVKSKHMELKLERVLTRAAEKGMDTGTLKANLDQFETLLAEARNEHNTALELFKEGKLLEAQSALQRAHQDLQKVHVILKDITAKLRALGLEGELEKDTESVIEEEVEEEVQKTLEEVEETE